MLITDDYVYGPNHNASHLAKTSADSAVSIRTNQAVLRLRKQSLLRMTNHSLHETLAQEANAFSRSRNVQRPYSTFMDQRASRG